MHAIFTLYIHLAGDLLELFIFEFLVTCLIDINQSLFWVSFLNLRVVNKTMLRLFWILNKWYDNGLNNLSILFRCSFTDDVDLSDLLSSMDDQIIKAKEQALSRKDILEKVGKWKFAAEEEKWLDDYERVKIFTSFCDF